nr:response regulator [Cupriavidus sp. 2SB]
MDRTGSTSRTRIQDEPLILVVDDDDNLRIGVEGLFRSVGMDVLTFPSADAFLAFEVPENRPCCLILDVRLRGTNGLELQASMSETGVRLPVVFISGFADIPMSVAAMRAGAINFLTKPFRDQDLLDAVSEALRGDLHHRSERRRREELGVLYESLTTREKEIMRMAATGRMNKQIADDIGLSLVTIKIHRAQAMRKMRAKTFADLVVMAHILGLCDAPAPAKVRDPVGA